MPLGMVGAKPSGWCQHSFDPAQNVCGTQYAPHHDPQESLVRWCAEGCVHVQAGASSVKTVVAAILHCCCAGVLYAIVQRSGER